MLADLWGQIWSRGAAPEVRVLRSPLIGGVAQAAARGETDAALLVLAARTLLTASKAQRAGVWIVDESGGTEARGAVADSLGAPTPQEWNRLDLAAHSLESLLRGDESRFVARAGAIRNAAQPFPSAGPYAGASQVVWLPLCMDGIPLGVGMIADHRRWYRAKESALRAIAEELTIALAVRRESARRAAGEQELEERERIERSIVSAAADVTLGEIAQAIERAVGAAFVAIGRRGVPIGASAGWAGAPGWRMLLMREPLRRLAAEALEHGKIADVDAASLRGGTQAGESHSMPDKNLNGSLARVVVLPLVADGAPLGLLMAGLGARASGDGVAKRLEGYSALATLALEREACLSHTAVLSAVVHHWLETTPDRLLLADETGHIECASRAARGALRLGSSIAPDARLDEVFAEASSRDLAVWLDALAADGPHRSTATPSANHPFAVAREDGAVVVIPEHGTRSALQFDAPLRAGRPARISVRACLPAARHAAHSWLFALDELVPKGIAPIEENRAALELSGLLDSLDSGVLVFDAAGRIRSSNDRFAQMMGLGAGLARAMGTLESLVEALSTRFARPADFASQWRLRSAGETSWDELELLRPERKIVERFVRPVRDAHGARIGWIEVYRDITGQRVMQSKLLQTEKMAALGQMISGIAHELSNPLTSIQGYAQLLLSRRPGPDRDADARRICQEAERAARIVKNLLLFAREGKPERSPVDMNEIVERALALRSYEMKNENIQVEFDLDERLSPILADASQMLQVVLNLLVNAEQALGQGIERELSAALDAALEQRPSVARIRIRTRRVSDRRLTLEVSDSGPGIAPEIIARIFDPFFTTKAPGVGTGLGLSIVYGIVHDHGGQITVESHHGHGAHFVIQLPVRPDSAIALDGVFSRPGDEVAPTMHTPLAAVSAGHAQDDGHRDKRILVVEDEPTVAQLIADVLTGDGYRVDMLIDSREAIERLRTQAYDLVICDLKMPHVDGRALYRSLTNANSPLQHRFVFVTGDTLSPHTLEFLKSSGLPYLGKPFLVEELKQVVQQAVARVHAEPTLAAVKTAWLKADARKP